VIRVALTAGEFEAELEVDAPYSPDVADDLARQARLSLATMIAEDGVLAALDDLDMPDDPDDDGD
jgi:hypothetical protein